MVEDIQAAQKSIYWEIYILLDDTETRKFFEALKIRARAGVKVKIVADWVGSFSLSKKIQEELRAAGGELLFFNRRWFFPRNHRKHLIIDERIAYLGGVNVGELYAKWADLYVRLTGKWLISHLLHSFIRVYTLSGGKDPALTRLQEASHQKFGDAVRKWKMELLSQWPVKGKTILRNYYEHSCGRAEHSILIMTPYFIPHSWLIDSLKKALTRGVRVEIVLPQKTDVDVANLANHIFADLNSRIGIRFYFLPFMIHAKALLIDNREGMIGSNNIDAQSFDYNIESSLVFERKDMIGDLRKIIEKWKASATPYQTEKNTRWYYYWLRPLFSILQKIL